MKPTDISVNAVALYFLPAETRIPLTFGTETLTSVTCARGSVRVENTRGTALGWGETPLSVQWVWPSSISYTERHNLLKAFCMQLAQAWREFDLSGHPMEIGYAFQHGVLPGLLNSFNQQRGSNEPMPWLAALVCCSVFDKAIHDAYGMLNQVPVYQTYNSRYMNADLDTFVTPDDGSEVSFKGKYPADFLLHQPPNVLPAWHLVGGQDKINDAELDATGVDDGYPVLLRDWIRKDGLTCLKVKLKGTDSNWDYERLVRVGELALEEKVKQLSTDFNCTVKGTDYVNHLLDKIKIDHPLIYDMILYIEQPFPNDLESNPIEVSSIAERKPLFMDESAHDWTMIRLGRKLGWNGVALKTCKTQTGAVLSACWAKAHGMSLMVSDLTNPMLAQIPHIQLARHVGTIKGVETNSMQFYPDVSFPEAQVHPGLYRRRKGLVDAATVRGPGFGYAMDRIIRKLPEPVLDFR